MRRTLLASIALVVFVSPLSAQGTWTAWDSPALISPVVPAGFSLFVINPAGGDLGALGTLRHAAGPVGLGYRASISDLTDTTEIAISAGVDVSGMLARGVEGSEIDVMWWAGGGIGIGTETTFSAPLGIILGWSGSDGGVILSPYAGGHVVLDVSSDANDNVALRGVFDMGLDLVLTSGWMLRVGASLGDREALALGIKIPGGGG